MALLSGSELSKFSAALEQSEIELFWDVREARMMVRRDGETLPCDDRVMGWLRFKLAEWHEHYNDKGDVVPYSMGRQKFYDLRDAVGHMNERDLFRDWLLALPPLELDRRDIEEQSLAIDWMLDDCLGNADTVYSRMVSRMLVLSAVWRTMEPGCKHDEVPVLKGKQGIGKDSLLTALVPWPNLCTTSFSFAMRMKEKIEATRGCLYVIASEMGGVTTTKDLEALKSFVTTDHDDMRMAYGRDKEVMPRRFVFACTTNLSRPLPNDPTGNRRWCVVAVDKSRVGAVEPWICERRERYWREALACYRMGIGAALPRAMKDEQGRENEELQRVDEQMEDAYLSAVSAGNVNTKWQYTLTEMAVKLALVESQNEFRREGRELQHRLRDELERQGWAAKKGRRHGGPVQRLWYHDDGV